MYDNVVDGDDDDDDDDDDDVEDEVQEDDLATVSSQPHLGARALSCHGDLRHSLLRTIVVLNSMANILPCVAHISIYIYMYVCVYVYKYIYMNEYIYINQYYRYRYVPNI